MTNHPYRQQKITEVKLSTAERLFLTGKPWDTFLGYLIGVLHGIKIIILILVLVLLFIAIALGSISLLVFVVSAICNTLQLSSITKVVLCTFLLGLSMFFKPCAKAFSAFFIEPLKDFKNNRIKSGRAKLNKNNECNL